MRASVWRDLIYSRVDGAVKAKGPNYYRLLLGQKQGKQNLASKQVFSATTLCRRAVARMPVHPTNVKIELDILRTFPGHRDFKTMQSEVRWLQVCPSCAL